METQLLNANIKDLVIFLMPPVTTALLNGINMDKLYYALIKLLQLYFVQFQVLLDFSDI